MKALIIYDSLYGNTKLLAEAMVQVFPPDSAEALAVDTADLSGLKAIDLLVVGSPTHGGRPKTELQAWLDKIPEGALKNIKLAVFDSRFLEKEQKLPLRLLMKTIGYAAPRLARILESKGGTIIAPPQGFIVTKMKGPLQTGELDRAQAWIKEILWTK